MSENEKQDTKSSEVVKLPTVSYSKITTFKACPKRYKFAYIDKIEAPPNKYTIFGNFCHEILEEFHKTLIKDYKNPTASDFKNIMREKFNSVLKEYKPKLLEEQIPEGYEIMKDYLSYMFAINANNKYPNILHLEKKIWKNIDNEFNFIGYVDRIQKDEDGIVHVLDYKTSKSASYLRDMTQMMLYGYFEYLENPKIEKVRTSFVMLRKNMKFITKEHSIAQLIETKNKFVEDWAHVKNEKLFRATPGYGTCTMCEHIKSCSEGSELMQRKKNFYGEETVW